MHCIPVCLSLAVALFGPVLKAEEPLLGATSILAQAATPVTAAATTTPAFLTLAETMTSGLSSWALNTIATFRSSQIRRAISTTLF